MSAIDKAITTVGGLSKLAEACGVQYQHVQYWRRAGSVPPKYWRAIERATKGRVKIADLLKQTEAA